MTSKAIVPGSWLSGPVRVLMVFWATLRISVRRYCSRSCSEMSGEMRAYQSSKLPLGEPKLVANRSAVLRAASTDASGTGTVPLPGTW
ncbi:Uncharacterised protein [Mycobacteroides abscessus subsp. abscessus]|nr:Uncharacterised protein [Mycobacteroides abscessus subsp. abscessus]